MLTRRWLLSTLPLLASIGAGAQQRKSLGDPLRLGADRDLVDSGLAHALVRAFGLDTGIAVKTVPGPALPVLEALERGELDAALTNAPEAEVKLDKAGLAHDRQLIAGGEFVLVGPAIRGKGEDALGAAKERDVIEALKRLASAPPGTCTFVSAADGSGAHAVEQALWRAAGIAPAPPWYVQVPPGESLLSQVRARGAYALVERGKWLAQGGAPLAIRVEADARLAEEVHAMRSFRANHPAGKIFVAWIASAKGHRVVASQRGYRAP
jgi:tungstate transport system substrate-binding protein